jgi:hypothetical protein
MTRKYNHKWNNRMKNTGCRLQVADPYLVADVTLLP